MTWRATSSSAIRALRRPDVIRTARIQADSGTRWADLPASAAPGRFDAPHSRTIRAATYDADTEHLTVQFVSGSTYGYDHVSEERWTRFAEAPSKGHFFGQHIRPQHAHSTKAGDVPIAVEI